MIESLSIRNFKVLREVDIKLQPLTVIVGPNASGKSSILQAISLLTSYAALYWRKDISAVNKNVFVGKQSQDHLRSRNALGPIRLQCQGEVGDSDFLTSLILDGRNKIEMEETHQGIWGLNPVKLLELDTHKLATPSYPQDINLDLPPDGTGLSSVLAGISLEHPEVFRQLIEQVKAVVPTIQNIRFMRVAIEEDEEERIGSELIFDMKGGPSLPAHAVSAGTLLTLGLLTTMTTPRHPPIILVDELERGLHPRALTEFVQQIRLLQMQNDRIQIIATSHSPYLLDLLDAKEILLTSLDETGFSMVSSLTEHPDYQRWKDLMAPGEFWSHVGEDWITQEKKAPA